MNSKYLKQLKKRKDQLIQEIKKSESDIVSLLDEFISLLETIDIDSLNSPKIEKKAITRLCKKCGKEFTPEGPNQKLCSVQCGLKRKTQKEKIKQKLTIGKNLSEEAKMRLENALDEIEKSNQERDSKPYEFNN